MVLRRASGEFASNLTGLTSTFAHQAVLAMRNARLFTEVDHKGRELAAAHETVQQQAAKLQEQTYELRNWNRSLEERVEKQLGEIGRIKRLERFLAPQVAQLIGSITESRGPVEFRGKNEDQDHLVDNIHYEAAEAAMGVTAARSPGPSLR